MWSAAAAAPSSDGPQAAGEAGSEAAIFYESMAKLFASAPYIDPCNEMQTKLANRLQLFLLLPQAWATEAGKRELLVKLGWTGQGQEQLRVRSLCILHKLPSPEGGGPAMGSVVVPQRHHLGLGERSLRS